MADAAVAHLHHLTPISEAVHRLRPELPLVVQLHGTEMNMVEIIRRGAGDAWPYAAVWADRMRIWAERAQRIITVSPTDKQRALALFDVPPDAISVISPGVDQQRFSPSKPLLEERLRLLEGWLVDEPRGWDETGVVGLGALPTRAAGAVRRSRAAGADLRRAFYRAEAAAALLLRAYARARRDHDLRAPLLVWGGFPGEWEGEHPVCVAREEGIDGVFFTGWHGHDELPVGLGCADVFVGPSVGEAFGQVFIEAMACGLPVITSASGGPLAFINTVPEHPNGWLVVPDNEQSLTAALVESTTGPRAAVQRAARSADALEQVRAQFFLGGGRAPRRAALQGGQRMTMPPPSGRQVALHHGPHHAAVVENGGGAAGVRRRRRPPSSTVIPKQSWRAAVEVRCCFRGRIGWPGGNGTIRAPSGNSRSPKPAPATPFTGWCAGQPGTSSRPGRAGATATHLLMPQPGYPLPAGLPAGLPVERRRACDHCDGA